MECYVFILFYLGLCIFLCVVIVIGDIYRVLFKVMLYGYLNCFNFIMNFRNCMIVFDFFIIYIEFFMKNEYDI